MSLDQATGSVRTIRQLPPHVVNQIAAGEVIERPASVVKELLENAIDAGATRVDVTIESGGLNLIRIADNGCGIEADQLPLAVTSHATSKITDTADLFSVTTLGFRGEALASIASVSRFLIRSRTPASLGGAELTVTGGGVGEVAPAAAPIGTVIEVRDLFFNVPVRRKFLRSAPTEAGHVSEAVTRVALAFPQVHLTLTHGGRTVLELPPTADWLERIGGALGTEVAGALLFVESREGAVGVSGYVAAPSLSRSHAKAQYLFLGGRAIRDRALSHALSEAYRGLLMTGRHPVCVLKLEMPPDLVDVNVHPTKSEVRFQDSSRLYSHLLGAIRRRFLSTDLTHHLGVAGGAGPPNAGGADRSVIEPTGRTDDPTDVADAEAIRQRQFEFLDWARRAAPATASGTDRPGELSAEGATADEHLRLRSADEHALGPAPWGDLPQGSAASGRDGTAPLIRRTFDPQSILGASHDSGPTASERHRADVGAEVGRRAPGSERTPGSANPAESEVGAFRDGDASPPIDEDRVIESDPMRGFGLPRTLGTTKALQVHNKYLILEEEAGMVVIDQHALHERILYEQFRSRVAAGKLTIQRLLTPEPVDLSAEEADAVMTHRDALARIGLPVEPFGGRTFLVTGYPAMIASIPPGEIFRHAVAHLVESGQAPEPEHLVDELLHMMSCKAAVKAGDPLTEDEIDSLLAQRDLCRDAHHCPHGRPTALVFTREELDRRFGRTGSI